MRRVNAAKILEIGPYPPPMAGWSIRIRFVKKKLESMGHHCKVLNLGKSRRVPSQEYTTVRNSFDYIMKTLWFAARGYTLHMHMNGDGIIGFLLSLVASFAGIVFGRRIVLSMHAGTHQQYFPRERSGMYFPILYLLFRLPKLIICNNDAVKQKIIEFGVPPGKIIPIRAFTAEYISNVDVDLPTFVESFCNDRNPLILTYAFLRPGYYWDTLVQGLELISEQVPQCGLVVAGSLDDSAPELKSQVIEEISERGLRDHICFAGDLTHEQFLTALRRSKVYLRTPTTDGDSSSVLESLALGIPVVAAENHNRPPGVVTYSAGAPAGMCERVLDVLAHHERYGGQLIHPTMKDTLKEEADALVSVALRQFHGFTG